MLPPPSLSLNVSFPLSLPPRLLWLPDRLLMKPLWTIGDTLILVWSCTALHSAPPHLCASTSHYDTDDDNPYTPLTNTTSLLTSLYHAVLITCSSRRTWWTLPAPPYLLNCSMSRRITSLGTYVCTLDSTWYVSSHRAYSMVHGAKRLINDTSLLHSLLFFPLHSLPPIVSSSFLLYLAPSEMRHFTPVPSLLLYLHLSLLLQTCRRCCPASEGIWKLRLYPGNTRHPLTLLRFHFTTTYFTTILFTKTHFNTLHRNTLYYNTCLQESSVQLSGFSA
jgi:hypothetical protein